LTAPTSPADDVTSAATSGDDEPMIAFGTRRARWVLLATVGASGMAFLDSTVVNVALPRIGDDLNTELGGLQWVINGYLLATSALILLGGSLGDIFGRRRVFLTGVVLFAAASITCGVAPNVTLLVGARVLQGVGGALLTPGSLAILEASFRPDDRPRAIGAWSGLSGVASAIGPFLGGWLIDAASWRWVFLINVPLAVLVVVVTLRHVPESLNPHAPRQVDYAGAVLIGLALAGLSWGLISAGDMGWTSPTVLLPLVGAVIALAAFVVVERRSSHPMVPPSLFTIAQFRAVNMVTVAVYAGLGTVFFLLVVQLQTVLGYSALEAGAATLPITLCMLVLSSRSGMLAVRIGPRLQMSVGPLVVAAGFVFMSTIDAGTSYVTGVLPGVLLVGLGLAATVAPLTATALGAVDDDHAGIASGVNTTVARAAQLAAVAAIPLAAGISGDSYRDADAFSDGFAKGMMIGAVLVALGGVIGWLTVRNVVQAKEVVEAGPGTAEEAEAPAAAVAAAAAEAGLEPAPAEVGRRAAAALAASGRSPELHAALHPAARFHCGLEGTAFQGVPIPPPPRRSSEDDATAA
jgi:EmrB/QacA subfamily drug resistance transporter